MSSAREQAAKWRPRFTVDVYQQGKRWWVTVHRKQLSSTGWYSDHYEVETWHRKFRTQKRAERYAMTLGWEAGGSDE